MSYSDLVIRYLKLCPHSQIPRLVLRFALPLLKLYSYTQMYCCFHRLPAPASALLLTLRLLLCTRQILRFLFSSHIFRAVSLSNSPQPIDDTNNIKCTSFALFTSYGIKGQLIYKYIPACFLLLQ